MTQDRHILLVDDDPRAIEFVDLRLRALGYRTTHAHDGEQAVGVVRSDRPVLVVLDVTMPEMNGYQTCREIKRIDRKIPVVIVTGKTDPADKFWAFQSGADAFFNKPVDPKALAQRIGELLGVS